MVLPLVLDENALLRLVVGDAGVFVDVVNREEDVGGFLGSSLFPCGLAPVGVLFSISTHPTLKCPIASMYRYSSILFSVQKLLQLVRQW